MKQLIVGKNWRNTTNSSGTSTEKRKITVNKHEASDENEDLSPSPEKQDDSTKSINIKNKIS